MKRAVLVAVAALWPIAACAQTNPGLMPGLSYTAPQISALFANKVDTVNGKASGLALTGGSLSGTAVDGATVGGVALSTALANAAAANVGLSSSQLALLNGALQATSNLSGNPVTVNGTASTVGGAISSNATAVAGAMTQINNEVTRAEAAEALKANTSALGTVAALNTGTASGNVPVIGLNGLLPSSVVPTSGSASVTSQSISSAGGLLGSNNLSDLMTPATARSNLGLGTAATTATTAYDASGAASTAQAASLQKSSNLSDLAAPATARTNLGLGSAAVVNTGTASGNVPTLPLTASEIPALSYASLASPAFTGAPTAPTQTTGDTSADLSTDAFVVATLSAGLQSALVNTSLTGVPTAPTASSSTSTTQLATTAFVQNLVAGVSGGASAAYTPTGGTTALKPADIQARNFDPHNYGALGTNSATAISTVYSNPTLESMAAVTVGGTAPWAYLDSQNNQGGLIFSLKITAITDTSDIVFTETTPGGNNIPSVAGVPQFCQVPRYHYECVLPGMVATDIGTSSTYPATAKSGTTGGNVASTVPMPANGLTQPSGTVGTVTLSTAESGWAVGDYVQFEVSPSMVAASTRDYWGFYGAILGAGLQTGGGVVNVGPGQFQMGALPIYLPDYYQNPVTVRGASKTAQLGSTVVAWSSDMPVGGSYIGDATGYVNNRANSEFDFINLAGAHVNSTTYGVAPLAGSTLFLGQNSGADHVYLNGGYAELYLAGDHHTISNSDGETGLYGAWRGPFDQSNGNDTFLNDGLQGTLAAYGVSYNATYDASTWVGGETAVEPHVFYKEPLYNSLIPSSALFAGCLTDSIIDDLQAEGIGGTPVECNGGPISNNQWTMWRPGVGGLDISTENQSFLWHSTSTIDHNTFLNSDPQSTGGGGWYTTAAFGGSAVQSNSLGDWGFQITTYPNKAIVLASNASSVDGNTMDNTILTSPTGQISGFQHLESGQNYSGGTLSAGTLIKAGANGFNYAQVATNSTCLSEPMGVIVQGGANNAAVFFATRGDALVNHYTTDSNAISPGSPLAVSCNAASSGAYGLPNAPGYVNGYGVSLGTSLMPTTTTATTLYVALAFSAGDPLRTDYNGGFNPNALTVANLPTSCNAGSLLYATNGRNSGEASGSGTGVEVFCHAGNAWWPFGGTAAVTQ